MAGLIQDFITLQEAVAEELDKYGLTNYILRFIRLAELRINREVRFHLMEKKFEAADVTNTITGGELPWPTRFQELKFCYIDGNTATRLDEVSMEELIERYPKRSATGKPRVIASDALTQPNETFNGVFRFGPFPDAEYTLKGTFYRNFTPLQDDSDTNPMLQFEPLVYLYGSVAEARGFTKGDPELAQLVQTHEALFRERVDILNRHQRVSRRSTTMRTRVR